MINKAIFLDRDGTLNYDPGYLSDSELVELLPGVASGLSVLKNELGFKLIVISNQSGIARKLITTEQVEKINKKINILLLQYKVSIDKFYYCPHHPEFDQKCSCRKPEIEMVLKAQKEFDIDLTRSYFVGDKFSDIECGNNAGVKTVLISDKNIDKIKQLKNSGKTPTFVAANFGDVCTIIKNDYSGED